MIDKSYLQELVAGKGIALDEHQLEQFSLYAQLLLEWNQKINLTAITDPKQIVIKHFYDSLLLLKSIPLTDGSRVADIGTGAGFPGIPLKLACKNIQLTLIDSLQKRLRFLSEVCVQIGIDPEIVHMRAEDGGHNSAYREQFDLVTARAVANLRDLCEYCIPYTKVGGFFVAYKGKSVEEELHVAKRAIDRLGCQIIDVRNYRLPEDNSERNLVLLKKISQTPTQYPRTKAKMTKSPL